MSELHLQRNEQGDLVLERPGESPVTPVRVVRCFPWSMPDRYISVRDPEKGVELALIVDPATVDERTRRLIDEELAAQDFVPRITKVERVDDRFEVTAWQMQTDRGAVELQIKSSDDIRYLEDRRVLFRDHAGGLFEIPDLAALDEQSQQLVEDRMG
ncbi:MAG: hypothetical protein CMJ18_15165 [Phycisphaeraceae bacterium]|nr:hypothetical protein [Phycisphaeraceae bacterium]